MNKRQAKKKIKKTIEKGWYSMTSESLLNLFISEGRFNKNKNKKRESCFLKKLVVLSPREEEAQK